MQKVTAATNQLNTNQSSTWVHFAKSAIYPLVPKFCVTVICAIIGSWCIVKVAYSVKVSMWCSRDDCYVWLLLVTEYSSTIRSSVTVAGKQRWSREHKVRGQGQGHKKNRRPSTALPRTDPLEAKERNAWGKGQGHRRIKCSPKKKVFKNFFQANYKILTIQKPVLSSSRGQANFRGLEASRPRTRTWYLRPRPRTSKCVLETKDILEDSPFAGKYRYFIESTPSLVSTL